MRRFIAAAILAAASSFVSAADLFSVDINSNGQVVHFGFKNAEDAVDAFKTQNLSQSITYTGVEQAASLINFRGLPIALSYAAGSSALVFQVPSLGINVTFQGVGGTTPQARDDAQEQLIDYLKSGNLLGQMMRELARVSPVDPVAGNPNSMQSQMVARDFNNGFTSHATNVGSPQQSGSVPNLIGVGVGYGGYKQGDFKTQSVTLPLSYTFRSNSDPGHQFSINLPVTMVDTEGATTYQGALGFAWRIPVTKGWALTPAANYGVAGSKDLGSVATMASGSLTSSYEWGIASTTLAMGNMVGHYRTLRFKYQDYDFDPEIRNTVYRNGFMWSVPMSSTSNKVAIEYSYINTVFKGTDIYVKSQNEFGLTIGTAKGTSSLSFIRFGVTYLYASNAEGFSANVGYWF